MKEPDEMPELIAGSGRGSRPSWWRRHVVSHTHDEPDRDQDPVAFFRTLIVLSLVCLPLWVVFALLLLRTW